MNFMMSNVTLTLLNDEDKEQKIIAILEKEFAKDTVNTTKIIKMEICDRDKKEYLFAKMSYSYGYNILISNQENVKLALFNKNSTWRNIHQSDCDEIKWRDVLSKIKIEEGNSK